MPKVPFTVSARTAKLIGQENFANAEGAIIELVKNCYDADARNCIIVFKNDSKHFHTSTLVQSPILYIIDNGIGMQGKIITDQWMKIGTDDKLLNYQSDRGRVKTGAKGIGRFALDRLGLASTMYTLSEQLPLVAYEWSVQWSDFDHEGLIISDVKADLNEIENPDLKSILKNEFPNSPKLNELIESLEFKSGTILKIFPLKDKWTQEELQSLYNNLEVLIPPQEQPSFGIHLFSTVDEEAFGAVDTAYYDDYDYKVKVNYLANENYEARIEIFRNELDVNELETRFREVFDSELMKNYPYDLETFKQGRFSMIVPLMELVSKADPNLLNQIGRFDFTFYFLKNALSDDRSDGDVKRKYPYKRISSSNRRAWLKKFGGLKIFRDDFRVRPYGENGQDWLAIGDRQAASPGGPGQKLGGYRIGHTQIAGTVNISRISNPAFLDKSGREGIIENDVFTLFKNILISLIGVFERDRNIIMYSLSELAKKKNADEEEKRKAQELADKIIREAAEAQETAANNTQGESAANDSGNNNNQTDNSADGAASDDADERLLFAKVTKSYDTEIKEKDEEIRLLRGLASVGLIISSFAHEVKSLQLRLIPRTDFLQKEINKYIDRAALAGINPEDDPFYMIQLIKEEDQKLKHWLDYSLSTLKRDKRKRKDINIDEYFKSFKETWIQALRQREVEIHIEGDRTTVGLVHAFEVDLDTVFNNLLSNTLEAFKEKKGRYQRLIQINCRNEGEFVLITFTDNGAGLASEYKNDPNRIFEYNESSKKDNKGNQIGTGMGLYMVKMVIDDYKNADVYLAPVEEGFSIIIKLPSKTITNHD